MDPTGERAFGIGHKIKPGDPEYDAVAYPCGTAVLQQRVQEVFDRDWETHVEEECFKLYPDFDCLPDFVQLVVGDMMFHMGYTRWAYTYDVCRIGESPRSDVKMDLDNLSNSCQKQCIWEQKKFKMLQTSCVCTP